MGDNSFSDNLKRALGIKTSSTYGFAECIDNADPLRIGRIRALPLSPNSTDKTLTDKEVAPWSTSDPHIYLSMIPYHINVVPMKGELVMVMAADGYKDTLDKIYVGPVISHPSKSKMDKSSNAIRMTSKNNQGVLGEPYLLGNPNTDVLNPKSSKKGVFPNPEDVALIGRDNTDIILGMRESSMPDESDESKENWYPQILIRSGKFKQVTDSTIPDRYEKPSFIQLNTFNKKYTYEEEEEADVKTNDTHLNSMIVYHIDPTTLSLTTSTNSGYVALYEVNELNKMGGEYKNEDIPGITSGILNEPLVRSNFTSLSISEARTLINDFISNIDSNDFVSLRKTLVSPDSIKKQPSIIHPLYFRPDMGNLEIMEASKPSGPIPTQPQFDLWKNDLVSGVQNKVKLSGVKTKGYGLALTSEKREVKTETSTKMVKKLKLQGGKQGFVTIGSDKVYIFSHDATDLGYINLSDTSYGVSQEKLITDIDGKTNSMVRGEELLKLLEKMVDFIEGHTHDYHAHTCCPQAKDTSCNIPEIRTILAEAPIKVLNQNIRIN
tara:strand:- start:2212 stop:3861 length:1650 start_codon:yes stop_codon:yes gene_type:complete